MSCLQTTPSPTAARPAGACSRLADPRSPAALAARVLAGDFDAEEELVTRYYRTVRAALRRQLRHRVDSEDLIQETFRMAIEKLRAGQLQQPSRLPWFLLSLARNLSINQFRIEKRRRTDADSEAVESRAFATPDALGRLIVTEKADLVRGLLAELDTPRDREILFRFYIAEDEKSVICDDLELSPLHFNRVLHRARRRYRRLYEQHAVCRSGTVGSKIESAIDRRRRASSQAAENK